MRESTPNRRSVLKATGGALVAGLGIGTAATATASSDNGVVAVMNGSDETPDNNEEVDFYGGNSSSEHGEIVDYEWTFDSYDDSGDYTYTRTGQSVDHAFYYTADDVEERTATLTVTDSEGNTASVSHQLTVYKEEGTCVPYGCDDSFQVSSAD